MNFAAGETTKQVTVLVNGDTLDEVNETFAVNLSNGSSATIADPQGVGTITDDDATPTLAITDATVTEGNLPATVEATFTVSLSAPSGQPVTVQAASANDTATAPADYTALGSDAPELRPRRDDEAGERHGQRRRARRGERDLLRQPRQPDERDDRRHAGRRHDH